MTESNGRVRTPIVWGAIAAAALLTGGIVWGVLANQPGAPDAASSTGPTMSVPPTPTVWPTPTPGATQAVAPDDPIEVALDEPGTIGDGVTATVTSVTAFESEGGLPGELGGPAVRVEIAVANTGDDDVDTAGAAVSITFGDDQVPGSELGGDGTSTLPAKIAPGATVSASYAFAVPEGAGKTMRVTLDLVAGKPMIVFEGNAPSA